MPRRALRILCSSIVAVGLSATAAVRAADLPLEGRPLVAELGKPRYAASRCLLNPLLANDGRTLIGSQDPAFTAGDVVLAIDGQALPAGSRTALIDVLEQKAPDATLAVKLQRNTSQLQITAHCNDSRPYYDLLRAAAVAAVDSNAALCAERLQKASRVHGLSTVWLRLAMSCNATAGTLSGDALWRTDYELFRQRIREVEHSPGGLDSIRHGIRNAVRDLQEHGHGDLAARLQKQFADAGARQADAPPGDD